MNNKSANKFTFDTEFRGQSDVVSDAARARQKKTMTAEEIEALKAESEALGSQAAQVKAAENIERTISALTLSLRAALDRSRAEIEAVRADAALLALAAAKKIAPAALAALPAGDVENALREAMHQAIGEPRITLRAAPEVIAALEGKINAIAHEEGYDGRVMLAADPLIDGADCRIEWRGGGSERSEAAIEAALDALITRRFSDRSENSKG
ncbi:MAG TPA: FliH/SctL family protein [Rhizomicrobium sp.]|jgi:flagellar assembly protein FliH|nr:FliH/SctL family protein [Rhizomicrobium sp.]